MKLNLKFFTHILNGYYFRAKPSGLARTPEDPRDFKTGIFGWHLFGGYTPKHKVWIIPSVTTKNQRNNTCQWNATAGQKEVDEKMPLSVKSLVAYGKQHGMVSGDGFSNLRDGQKALYDFGIVEQELLPETTESQESFAAYSGINLTPFTPNANKHKTSSYWSVSSLNDLLKLLDENRQETTGIDWDTGYNQGGGFARPWLITGPDGIVIGGHAFKIVGYEYGYQGRNVLIMKNSYGSLWGDTRKFILDDGREIVETGLFYMDMNFFINNNYGMWANLDIGVDLGAFLMEYDGKNVKCKESPTIYRIQAGKKKPYLHEMDYFVYNIEDSQMKNFSLVDKEILDKVELGDNMDLTKSLYWPALMHINEPLNLTRVIEAIAAYKANL